MSHNLSEPYSGKNPVPQIATKLTSLLNPERATEAKAQQLQDQTDQRDQKQTEKRASKLAKGHVMRVTDPTTGEELDIRNADDEPDTKNQGDNVLDTDFPPPGACILFSVAILLTCVRYRLGGAQNIRHYRNIQERRNDRVRLHSIDVARSPMELYLHHILHLSHPSYRVHVHPGLPIAQCLSRGLRESRLAL